MLWFNNVYTYRPKILKKIRLTAPTKHAFSDEERLHENNWEKTKHVINLIYILKAQIANLKAENHSKVNVVLKIQLQ